MREGTNRTLIQPLRDFLATESAGGIAVVLAAVTAIAWANSPWQASYDQLWSTMFELRLGSWYLTMDLQHWVNEALMTIFFLIVGLEIKRELVEGELKEASRRSLPVFAAFGGMILPALLFVALNPRPPEIRGWGIPMATDIALAVGVITIVGSRIRPSLKLFLLALAIVDDIGAILVIGLFYTGGLKWAGLVIAAALIGVTIMIRRRVNALAVYLVLGAALWLTFLKSGIHPTLAGVAMGLLAPTKPRISPELIDQTELANLGTIEDVVTTRRLALSSVSVVEWLEHGIHTWTSFLIVPLFALANAGIHLSDEALASAASAPVAWGIVVGLLVGKPLGILVASAIAVRSGAATLPDGVTWTAIAGVGLLAGMGFTVSLFVAELALMPPLTQYAKIGILTASVLAGGFGYLILRRRPVGPSMTNGQ
ncbi:MAG: Na+/H+ antiporter NhaA [Acidimicrobiia bacterium]